MARPSLRRARPAACVVPPAEVSAKQPFTAWLYVGRVWRMSRRAAFSAQALAVLAARPSAWRHGYDLARETGLKSGTLYPILVRLADREIVQACWEEGEPAGRPRRHLYRLTSDGLAAATVALAAAPAPATRAARPGRASVPRRLAGEGS